MAKFKVGDVIVTESDFGTDIKIGNKYKVVDDPDADDDDDYVYFKDDDGDIRKRSAELYKLVKRHGKEPKVNFLLKYDLDQDPIEEFETLDKVRTRIKELMDNEDLQKDSIVIYEIKSKKEVELKTSTTINIK